MTIAEYEQVLVGKDIPIIDAVKIMNTHPMQILIVADDRRKLLGVVTDGDVRRALLDSRSFSDPVEAIMTRNPVTLRNPPDKHQAIQLMKKHDIRHIPLTDGEGRIAGLLLWRDFYQNGDVDVLEKTSPVFIMAGGKGKRLDVFTKILPKPLIPVGDKPIIEHIMDHFHRFGFQRFLLSLNYKAEMIRLYFADNGQRKYQVEYLQEKDPLGTAGSLALGRGVLNETFVVSNCDVLVDANMERLLQYHKENFNDATILGIIRNVEIPYGVLKTKMADVEDIIEKPEYHFVINSGIYVLEPHLIDLIDEGQRVDMPELLLKARKKGFKVQSCPMTCSWFDVGQWGEYKRAIQHMSSLEIEH